MPVLVIVFVVLDWLRLYCIVCFLTYFDKTKTGSVMMTCLMASNAFYCSDSHAHLTPELYSLLSGSESLDKTGLNFFR